MSRAEFVRETWEAVSGGDLDALQAALVPDAKWYPVEEGPWDCESRTMIVQVMRRNLNNGLAGDVEEVFEVGDRVVVAFRPDSHEPGARPLDEGLRYLVLTMRGSLVAEMKGCADRQAALAYASSAPR
jgi:ketosteroid isomerase-like protein